MSKSLIYPEERSEQKDKDSPVENIMIRIRYKNKTIGILIRAIKRGSLPQTAVEEPLQLITIKHPKGKHLLAHTNEPVMLRADCVQEALVMRKGRVRMNLYGPDSKLFKKIFLVNHL